MNEMRKKHKNNVTEFTHSNPIRIPYLGVCIELNTHLIHKRINFLIPDFR